MSKPLHEYITKTTLESQEIDKQLSLSWTTKKYITSHFESYAFASSEQEINTKDLNYRRNKAKNPFVYIDTNVDFARLVLKMFSIFFAAVQKCQANTTYHWDMTS